jgi:K+-sensing histidine kinase KdpD
MDEYDLVRTLAHDLKSPLTVIKGYAHILKRSLVDSDKALAEKAEKIDENAMRMLKMIDQVQLYYRIKAGQMEFKFETRRLEDLIASLADAGVVVETNGQLTNVCLKIDKDYITEALLGIYEQVSYWSSQEEVRFQLERDDNTLLIQIEPVTKNDLPLTQWEDKYLIGWQLGVLVMRAHRGSVGIDGGVVRLSLPCYLDK